MVYLVLLKYLLLNFEVEIFDLFCWFDDVIIGDIIVECIVGLFDREGR